MGKIKGWKKVDCCNWRNEKSRQVITLWGTGPYSASFNRSGKLQSQEQTFARAGNINDITRKISMFMRQYPEGVMKEDMNLRKWRIIQDTLVD